MKAPLGITYNVPPGRQPKGVYESEDGVEAFESDGPYLIEGTEFLASPLPVFNAGGPVFEGEDGKLYQSLAISGVTPIEPDPDGITWDQNTPWDNGTYWS